MCHSIHKIQYVIYSPSVTYLFNVYQQETAFQYILIASSMTVLELEHYNIVENLKSKLYRLCIKSIQKMALFLGFKLLIYSK